MHPAHLISIEDFPICFPRPRKSVLREVRIPFIFTFTSDIYEEIYVFIFRIYKEKGQTVDGFTAVESAFVRWSRNVNSVPRNIILSYAMFFHLLGM